MQFKLFDKTIDRYEYKKFMTPPDNAFFLIKCIILFFMSFQKISIVLLILLPLINGYKILYMVPFPAPSHWMWLKHFAEEMLKRGHEVSLTIFGKIIILEPNTKFCTTSVSR